MSFARLRFGPVVLLVAGAVTACDDPLALPPPSQPNTIDTLVVFALSGTQLEDLSAYDLPNKNLVRTDQTSLFDFAYDIDGQNAPRVFPARALGLEANTGVQFSEDSFEGTTTAPLEDYVTDSSIVVGRDSVFIIRSRPIREALVSCAFFLGALPRYGKFRVLEIDEPERRITLETLVNVNCGYRDLEPGLPVN